MNLRYLKLGILFPISFLLMLSGPLFNFPSLAYFAPFLIAAYYQKPLNFCLWASLACGFILDVLSSRFVLGFYSLSYVMTTTFLYHQQRHFFADRLSTLPVMTFMFSFLSNFLQILLIYFLGNLWEGSTALTDAFITALKTSFYLFLIFIFPLWIKRSAWPVSDSSRGI